jgi:hypothetical protein
MRSRALRYRANRRAQEAESEEEAWQRISGTQTAEATVRGSINEEFKQRSGGIATETLEASAVEEGATEAAKKPEEAEEKAPTRKAPRKQTRRTA